MLTQVQKEGLMQAALEQAQCGMKAGEAPIGCVLARGEGQNLRIVARGYNRVNALQRKIAHAEIVTFENASGGLGESRRLPRPAEDPILVSTLEPWVMCLGAAMEAGVRTVLFGLKAPANNGTQSVQPPESPESCMPEIESDILAAESRRLFEQWLESHRDRPQAAFGKQLLALT